MFDAEDVKALEKEGDLLSQKIISDILGENFWIKPQQIYCYASLDSTNTTARTLALEGACHGTLVITDAQVNGKGRLGRPWASKAGEGLWFSLILRPKWSVKEASRMSFLIAAAVSEGIRMSGALAEIKWPNDILINQKKVCGILIEMGAQKEQADYFIAGIGINVNQRREDFAPELQDKATSLAEASGKKQNRLAVLKAVLAKIEAYLELYQAEGFEAIKAIWLKNCCILEKEVCILHKNTVLQTGRVWGIDDDGALLLKTENGLLERVLSGDVSLRAVGKTYI